MRILIVSDTHGKHDNFDQVIEEVGKIDLLIHAGDVDDETYIEAVLDCPKHMVQGNCDWFSYLPREKVFGVGDKTFWLTHGHEQQVNSGMERMILGAKQRNADVVIFGHTHIPFEKTIDGILFLNPGSLSKPRQSGREPSYILMTISGNGELKYKHFLLCKKK